MANLCTAGIIIPPVRGYIHSQFEEIITGAHCRAVFRGVGQFWVTVLMHQHFQILRNQASFCLGGAWSSGAWLDSFSGLHIVYLCLWSEKLRVLAYSSIAVANSAIIVGGSILAFWQWSCTVDIAYGSESVDKTWIEKNSLMNLFHQRTDLCLSHSEATDGWIINEIFSSSLYKQTHPRTFLATLKKQQAIDLVQTSWRTLR